MLNWSFLPVELVDAEFAGSCVEGDACVDGDISGAKSAEQISQLIDVVIVINHTAYVPTVYYKNCICKKGLLILLSASYGFFTNSC